MNLISVELQGFRRFAKRSSMNVDGKLIAIVGPNESGKSSFLEALTELNHNEPLTIVGGAQQTTRNETIPETQKVIRATYALDTKDREALRHVHGGDKVHQFTLVKRTNGEFYYIVKPRPHRALEKRTKTRRQLIEVSHKRGFLRLVERHTEVDLRSQVDQLADTLNTEVDTISSEDLENVESVTKLLEDTISSDDPKYLQKLVEQLHDLAEYETGNPFTQAVRILVQRRPEFLFFSDEERSLQSSYDLNQVWEDPPAALRNLARVAELDLRALHRAIQTGDTAQVATIRETANARLRQVFASAWFQSEIAVGFDTDGSSLRVFVTEAQTQFTNIAERSDGLRQFVALLAFATVKDTNETPILLIDEAETHLHYDAQADLVQMLTKQEIVSKVIYTTHSIGCLPEDLGTGVRLIEVEPEKPNTSIVRNWFWQSDRPGFSPLLFGMGASTLAFIPVRHAVVAEGIVDCILWPSLMREATGRSHLNFQIVPGISEANLAEIKRLDHEAPGTAYLIDADDNGVKLREQLLDGGIPESHIFLIPDSRKQGLEVEDLIDEEVFIAAINEELNKHNGVDIAFPKSKLPISGRVQVLKTWCKHKKIDAPNKRAVAYRIIEQRPNHSILADRHRKGVRDLYNEIIKVFQQAIP